MVNYLIKDASWGQFKLYSKNDLNQNIEIQFPLKETGKADVLLWNKHYELWNWKDKKTYVDTSLKTPLIHSPGITLESLEYIINRYPNIDKLIISKGYGHGGKGPGQLPVDLEKLNKIKKKYPKLVIVNQKTNLAIKEWNESIKKGLNVGMLLHMTC